MRSSFRSFHAAIGALAVGLAAGGVLAAANDYTAFGMLLMAQSITTVACMFVLRAWAMPEPLRKTGLDMSGMGVRSLLLSAAAGLSLRLSEPRQRPTIRPTWRACASV